MEARFDLFEEGAVEIVDAIKTREKKFTQVIWHQFVASGCAAKPLKQQQIECYHVSILIDNL